ncbi:MAG TPA: hypothetical protein VF618_16640 [Thermoanaerobaculia bacterium]
MVTLAGIATLSLAVVVLAQERPPLTHVPQKQQQKPPARQQPRDTTKQDDAAERRRQMLVELARIAAQEAQRRREAQRQPPPQRVPSQPIPGQTTPGQPLPTRPGTTPGTRPEMVRPTFPPPASAADDERWFTAWEEREGLFEAIDPAAVSDEEKKWAIATLREEAAFLQRHFLRTKEGLGEAYGAYYIDLALFVTKLKDPRSIESLAVAMDVAPVISTTLAEMGDPAVDPVLAAITNPFLRESSAYTLGKFLQGSREGRSRLSPANVTRIRQTLVRAALSDVPSLRKNALRALKNVELTSTEQTILRRAGVQP